MKRVTFFAALMAVSLPYGEAHSQSFFQRLFGDGENSVSTPTDSSGGGGNTQASGTSGTGGNGGTGGTPIEVGNPATNPGSASQSQPQSGWAAEGNGNGTVWGSGSMSDPNRSIQGAGSGDGWCDRNVALADERNRASVIEGRTALARQNFSLMPQGMLSLSCVDRILNTGLNIFNLDFLDNIMNNIRNTFSCQRVLQRVNSYANQQVSQYVGGAISSAVGSANSAFSSTGIGQAIPGVSLGTFTGNINMNPAFVNIGGAGSGQGSFMNFGQSWNSGGSMGYGNSGFRSSGGGVNMGNSLLGLR